MEIFVITLVIIGNFSFGAVIGYLIGYERGRDEWPR